MENADKREMQITKRFKAPLSRLWKAWTDPEQVVNWWGPAGFTSTIHVMDVKKDGEWKLTLHGPDGTNYPNRSVYLEVVPMEKIMFEHFNPHFITTVLFEDLGEESTISWTMRFDSVEMRDTIVKVHKADEGQKQNVEKLEGYLNSIG